MKEHNYTREVFLELTLKGLRNSLDYSKRKAFEVFEETDDAALYKDSMALVHHLERVLMDEVNY